MLAFLVIMISANTGDTMTSEEEVLDVWLDEPEPDAVVGYGQPDVVDEKADIEVVDHRNEFS